MDRIYDFADTVPDSRLLPYKEFNHCVNKAVELYKANLFSYGDPQGLQSLRQAIGKYFSHQQIFTKEENVFITSGSQQALNILLKMKFPNKKKKILVEQPTYSLIHKIVQLNEDDYLGDLDINKKNLPLFYYDIYERVIYVKSFSKTFMPGIRVGVVAMYDKLKTEFLNHKKCMDNNT